MQLRLWKSLIRLTWSLNSPGRRPIEVGDVGRAADGREIDVVAADDEIALGVARVHLDGSRRQAQELADDLAAYLDHAGLAVDLGAVLLEDVERLLAHELETQLLEHAEGRVLDPLQPLLVQNLERRQGVLEPAPRRLGEPPASARRAGARASRLRFSPRPWGLPSCRDGTSQFTPSGLQWQASSCCLVREPHLLYMKA